MLQVKYYVTKSQQIIPAIICCFFCQLNTSYSMNSYGFPSDSFISSPLPRFLHHRLRADAVPPGRVVHEYVGHGANELPVLDNGAAA